MPRMSLASFAEPAEADVGVGLTDEKEARAAPPAPLGAPLPLRTQA